MNVPPKIDAVLSYHLNPYTCGVARFNLLLAKHLGVPCLPFGSTSTHPLVSIKTSEMDDHIWRDGIPTACTLLLHDRPTNIPPVARLFYADETGCPSTIEGNPHRGLPNVLMFGMSHKIDVHTVYIDRLRDLLTRAHTDYTVSVSTAVHEGSPWDGAFTKTIDNLRTVFGHRVRVLGYLADDALVREMQDCQTMALFFDPAARANNTTLWTAMQSGTPVITNLDTDSPPECVHHQTVFDISRMTDWPFAHLRRAVGHRGQQAGNTRTWATLIETLRA